MKEQNKVSWTIEVGFYPAHGVESGKWHHQVDEVTACGFYG